jgi:hypothetical protein
MQSLEDKFEKLMVDNYRRMEMGIWLHIHNDCVDYKDLENEHSRVLLEWCRFCENNGVGRYRRGGIFSGIVLSDPCDSDFVLVMSRDDVLKLLAFGLV